MRASTCLSSSIIALAFLSLGAPARAETAAKPSTEGSIPLDTVDVNADGSPADQGFVARQARAGTKTEAPLAQTPLAVSVVTREQMDNQGAQTVQEALHYEVGVVSDARPGNRYDTVFIRGFGGFGGNANYIQYWDGLRIFKGLNYAVPGLDPYLLERIDVARGPVSSVYGQGSPGGAIDIISKWPDIAAKNEVFATIGNHGTAETGVDLNGRLNADGSLLYRFVGVGRLDGTDVDAPDSKRVVVAPMIAWQPNESTRLRVQLTYENDPSSYYSMWLPALGTLQVNPSGQIPRDFYANNPSFGGFTREQTTLAYQFEHSIDNVWTVRQNFRYIWLDTDFEALSVPASGSAWAAASACGGYSYRCLALSASRYVESVSGGALDNQAIAKFSTGPLDHKLLLGADLQRYDASSLYGTGATSYVNVQAPVWSVVASPSLNTQQDASRMQVGGYAQDQINYGDWHALLGVREDYVHSETTTTALTSRTQTSFTNDDSAFTYRAGLLYQFRNGIAPYVSYATSFDPAMGTGYGGTPFLPTTGQSFEAGVKYQPTLFNGLFTVSYFDITQQNVLTTDTQHTSTNTAVTLCSAATCQTQTGEINSRGIEVSGKAEILPKMNLTLAYAYTDAEVTKSNVSGVQGKVPVGVPQNAASAWLDYTWVNGWAKGVTLGGGARYVGETYGDQTNTAAMVVPERVLFDAAVHYDFGGTPGKGDGWRASVTATNLTDKYYVSACASANQCFVGTGRTVLGTLAYHW
ncbi:TonB-dependent siderophore receptor [Azorhizobium doebereinerae]|uniref:TonB-dependent siderophore receptor n=1 Tax=Azorhizobium doebereinerae TaxID=281091 RepID=UPI000416A1EF|nr:TonB-dependent siderophore receptor [Azorhizobium doebereinerae]